VAVVAVEALPLSDPVIVPAVKLPEASRFTIVEAVFRFVAALAAFAPDATLAADTPPTAETTVAACVPVTSPAKEPLKLVADVAVDALPLSEPVIVPAVKLPDASRFTIVEAVFRFVAALAEFAPDATLAADTPPTAETTVAACVPVTSPASEPLKLVAVVAVEALPLSDPVIVPAVKLPEASRLTIVEAVFRFVAALAAFAPDATFPADTPPTVATVFAEYDPVTSPARLGKSLAAIVATVQAVPPPFA
jgi:hypothetical protein